MYHNIPFELRQLVQWVCANEDKIPLNPRTGDFADCNDPSTWGTFDEAVGCGRKYIGFVLTLTDPYCVIDLDYKTYSIPSDEELAVHQRIIETFDSYIEKSANGLGHHVVTKASIVKGRRRGNVEVYSQQRYMIFTGNVVKNSPINDCQALIDQLVFEMPDTLAPESLIEVEEVISDSQLVDRASNAINGEKFDKLCNGEYYEDYPSQSEADFALMAMLAYYSKSNSQCRRVFRCTALGKREKAHRDDYLNFAISKIRSVLNHKIDLEQSKKLFDKLRFDEEQKVINKVLPPPPPKEKVIPPPPSIESIIDNDVEYDFTHELEYPPGFVGEIARYFYSTAIRPVKEIAILAAMVLVSGINGRCFNISGSGLNQYLILLAKTGSGKEGAANAVEQLVKAISSTVPSINDFIGPASFSSGQALVRALSNSKSFCSILGEFGITLQQISDINANSGEKMFKKVLLDIYGKSGHNSILRPSVYADIAKNTEAIISPNLSILGEGVPETFFESLEQAHISEGLVPRFSIIEYTGGRPERNKNCNQPPSPMLISKFAAMVSTALSLNNKGQCTPVPMDVTTTKLMDSFDVENDKLINSSKSDVESQLWNRAHLKALKISALLASAENPNAPVVTGAFARWAIAFVRKDVNTILSRFIEGNIGTGENKQAFDMKHIIRSYATLSNHLITNYQINPTMWQRGVIPLNYLSRRCSPLASFRKDRAGTRRALKECIQSFIDQGLLVEIPVSQTAELFNTKSKCYAIGDSFK